MTRILLFGFGGLSILSGVFALVSSGLLDFAAAAPGLIGGALLFAVSAILELLIAIRDRPADGW